MNITKSISIILNKIPQDVFEEEFLEDLNNQSLVLNLLNELSIVKKTLEQQPDYSDDKNYISIVNPIYNNLTDCYLSFFNLVDNQTEFIN